MNFLKTLDKTLTFNGTFFVNAHKNISIFHTTPGKTTVLTLKHKCL